MADLSISLGVETAGLDKAMASARVGIDGLKKAASGKGLFAGIESQVSSLQGKFGGVFEKLKSGNILGAFAGAEGMGAALGGVAIAAGGVAAAAAGMWNAMSKGKELTVLADQTNLTIPQLMTLEKVVGKVGMTMDEMPAMMGKFNAAMTDLSDPASKTSQALAKVGLNAQSFQGKSYYEGLKTLAKAMGETTSATDKMSAAAAVFGTKKGNLMMPVMKAEAFAKAESVANPVADIYEQFGPAFAQFQAAITKLALSFQPFFAGMASEVIPVLMPLVSGLESMAPKLVAAGVEFGKEIAVAVLVAEKAWDKIKGATVDLMEPAAKAAPTYTAQIAGGFGGMGTFGGGAGIGIAEATKEAEAPKPKASIFEEARAQVDAQVEAFKKSVTTVKPNEPTIDTGTVKAMAAPALIASSFTKIGAGGEAWGGGDAMMNIQREQLAVQTRMANALERQLASEKQTGMGYKPGTEPLMGD